MNLLNLIDHLKTIQKAAIFIARELPGVELDFVDIYLKDTLAMESEVFLFNAEEIPNNILIAMGGMELINLLPLNLAQEMVESYVSQPELFTDAEIAEKLLRYRLKDA